MSNIKPRVRVPKEAAAGEVIVIKTLLSHPMESGQRRDAGGQVIPRKIVNRFTCTFEGETVLDVTLEPSISANPFLEFQARVDRAGTFVFEWHDDDGSVYKAEEPIAVA